MIYWGIVAGLFAWATWNIRKRYIAESKLCDYQDALKRMIHERDMLQKDIDDYQRMVYTRTAK